MAKKAETTETAEVVENIVESGGTLAEKAGIQLTYSKRQFINGKEYKQYRDLLTVLLEDNKFYSKADVTKMINNYLKGKVN